MKIRLLLITFLIFQGVFAQNFKFGKVSKEELLEKQHPLDSSANAAVLFRDVRTNFEHSQEDGFYIVTNFVERIKIYNKEAFDLANKEINLYIGTGGAKEQIGGLKGYTYYMGEDGKVKEEKLKNSGIFDERASKYRQVKKIVFPNITEGCIIEYKYSIQSPFIDNIDEYRFQEEIPVNNVTMVFKSPEYFNYKTHQKGWLPLRVDRNGVQRTMRYSYRKRRIDNASQINDETVTTDITFTENINKITLENVPAMVEESFSGNIDNYASSIKFELSYTQFPGATIENYSKSWETVSKNIMESPSFGDELSKNKYFKKDIDDLLAGVSGKNEKMMAIFEFVKGKMNWNGYKGYYVDDGVRTAFKNGTGNVAEINLMLTAMFKYAGISANPVLVSTKNNGVPLFATRNGFDYVVAGVEKDNGVILFDATNKQAEASILNPRLLNWQGRIIRKDNSSDWVPLKPGKHAAHNTMINATINPDASVKGTAKNSLSGHYALFYRNKLLKLNETDTQEYLEKNIGETELSNLALQNLDELYQPVKIDYDFESFDRLEEVEGKLYFSPMLYMAVKENPFKLNERNYPIDFEYPFKDRCIISIEIPEGYAVESIPEPISLTLSEGIGHFKYSVTSLGNKVQVSTEFSVNNSLVPPQYYLDLKEFYKLVIEKENEKIVLSKI